MPSTPPAFIYPEAPALPSDVPIAVRPMTVLAPAPIVEEGVDLLGGGERTPRVEEFASIVTVMYLALLVVTQIRSMAGKATAGSRAFLMSPGPELDSLTVIDDRPLLDQPITHAQMMVLIETAAPQLAREVERRRVAAAEAAAKVPS